MGGLSRRGKHGTTHEGRREVDVHLSQGKVKLIAIAVWKGTSEVDGEV